MELRPLESFEDFARFLGEFTNFERLRQFSYGPEALPLERMREFSADVGDPHRAYPSVHVAGTKGKGSTCLMLEALLAGEGFTAGCYLSPHVEHLRERIRIAREPIAEEDVRRVVNSFLPALRRRYGLGRQSFPTFFELMTAIAMHEFATRRVDWGIFEVGLGGRLDATNILSPRLTAITSIGLEHTHVLGDTLAKIATEKAGIIKPGVPVALGQLPDEAERAILAIARDHGAPVLRPEPDAVQPLPAGRIRLRGVPGTVSSSQIHGPALRSNLALALLLHRHVLEQAGRQPDAARTAASIESLELPARVEHFPGAPPVLLDGAHTFESFTNLRDTLEEIRFPRPRTVVFSIASDKLIGPILETLPAIGERFYLTSADSARARDPREIRGLLGQGEVIEPADAAVRRALDEAGAVVVCGSIYLAGVARPLLRARAQRQAAATGGSAETDGPTAIHQARQAPAAGVSPGGESR